MAKSPIEWTDSVWSPVTGCSPVSAGCAHCYARRMANRLRGRYGYPADEPFRVTLHEDRLHMPLGWRKPQRIFVCSMGDLFHEDVPADFICEAYCIMAAARQHTFVVLTKRPQRIVPALYGAEGHYYLGGGDSLPNIWHLVSVEDQGAADRRIPELLRLRSEGSVGWPVLGVSCEPLLAPLNLTEYLGGTGNDRRKCLRTISWVIAGCESGPGRRPAETDWFRSLRDQCRSSGTAFFLKQTEHEGHIEKMPVLDGVVWSQTPGY